MWKRGELSFVSHTFLCGRALKGDYIIGIVASEPSAFPHWTIYSGLSAPDKDRAFRQFSGQETQTLGVTPHYSQTHQSTQSAAGKTMNDTRSLDFWQRNRVTPVWTHCLCWNRPSLAFPLVLFRWIPLANCPVLECVTHFRVCPSVSKHEESGLAAGIGHVGSPNDTPRSCEVCVMFRQLCYQAARVGGQVSTKTSQVVKHISERWDQEVH